MINVSPRQLQVFVGTVDAGSLRAAAARLHLTQPAASMALAEMERLLGAPVFDRERGRLRLNARGRELMPLARELLERHADFGRRAAMDGGRLSGELRIGTSNTVGNYRVGELLGPFVRAQPGVSIRLQVDNTTAIARALLRHELDVGCVEGPAVDPALEALPWREDRLLLCAPAGHPLAGRTALRPADLAGTAWVLREPGSATRALSELVLARLPAPVGILELSQSEAIRQAVAAGLGVALLPEVAVDEAIAAGRLAHLEVPVLEPLLTRRMSLLLPRGRYRGAALEAFVRAATRGLQSA